MEEGGEIGGVFEGKDKEELSEEVQKKRCRSRYKVEKQK